MIKESISSFWVWVWTYLYGWLTPTILFLLLNLVIGTIAITSGLGSRKHQQQSGDGNQADQQQLARAPSVLERFKSLNLYRYKSQDLNPFSSIATTLLQVQTPEIVDAHQHEQKIDESPDEILGDTAKTTDLEPEPVNRPKKTKPVNEKSGSGRVEETEEITSTRRSSTVKVGKSSSKVSDDQLKRFGEDEEVEAKAEITSTRKGSAVKVGKSSSKVSDHQLKKFGADEEVDAKADDFINRFKQQLRLQRLDSIMRYKEMLSGGRK